MFKSKPNTPAELEAKITAAQEHLEQIQHEANATFLAAEEGHVSAQNAAAVARDAIVKATSRISELSGALLQARQLEATARDDAAAEELAGAWAKTEKLAKQYQTLAVQIETDTINLANKYRELETMTADLFDITPIRSGRLRNAGLSTTQMEKSFRLHCHKIGWKWAAAYPYDIAAIPAFSDVMKASAKAVMAFKEQPQ